MEDIRKVAAAYHARATDEEKEEAKKFFRSLDSNSDGKISFKEFKSRVRGELTLEKFFSFLDENEDGTLDFKEFVVFYYMRKSGLRSCDCCDNFLIGSYFSCLMCEKDFPKTYDLCCSCYSKGIFRHRHSTECFLDSRSMQMLLGKIMNGAQVSLPDAEKMKQMVSRTSSSRDIANEVLGGFLVGTKIGNTMVTIGNLAVSAGCSIM